MPKGKMIVYTNSISPERDAEFNVWYDSVHVPDVLKIDGIIGCTRFKVAESPAAETPGKYLAIYDVEVELDDILDVPVTAFTDGSLPTNDCLVPGPITSCSPRPDEVQTSRDTMLPLFMWPIGSGATPLHVPATWVNRVWSWKRSSSTKPVCAGAMMLSGASTGAP